MYLTGQDTCDGATSCSYTYDSQLIDDCSPGYDADYLQLVYSCQTDDTGGGSAGIAG